MHRKRIEWSDWIIIIILISGNNGIFLLKAWDDREWGRILGHEIWLHGGVLHSNLQRRRRACLHHFILLLLALDCLSQLDCMDMGAVWQGEILHDRVVERQPCAVGINGCAINGRIQLLQTVGNLIHCLWSYHGQVLDRSRTTSVYHCWIPSLSINTNQRDETNVSLARKVFLKISKLNKYQYNCALLIEII